MRTTSRWLMPALSLTLLFGSVGVAQAAGWWVASGRESVAPETMTPSDLKGWMTLQQAADGLGVPVDDLIGLVGAPQGVAVTGGAALKDLESIVSGFDLTAYRDRVQAYLDGSAATAGAATSPTNAPSTALPTLPTGAPSPATPTGTPTGTPEGGVRGTMTVREVAAANGLDVSDLLAAARLPADLDPGTVLRDIQESVPGFEIQAIRDAVAALSG